MEKVKPYILKLEPAFKDYIWGGRRLIDEYKMDCNLERLSEAWVLSCHKDGPSTVKNGPLCGKTLEEAIGSFSGKPCGEHCDRFDFFPVLIKLIDAKRDLSIQVHPDDNYAAKHEGGYGKTEMWYVVDCDKGASIYYGFKNEISKEDFRRSIEENTLTDLLKKIEVKKGDCFFIPAGTVHAIGAGMLIAEIQQSSNSTYRVYDYGRLGTDGKPRELHIEKALDVAVTAPAKAPHYENGDILADCQYFKAEKKNIGGQFDFAADGTSFVAVLAVEGKGNISGGGESLSFSAGDCFFVPAKTGECRITGEAVCIFVTV